MDETKQTSDLANGTTIASLQQEVLKLRAELELKEREHEETRRLLFALRDVAFPNDPPPTEEELLEEGNTLSTKSISDFLRELETAAQAEKPE